MAMSPNMSLLSVLLLPLHEVQNLTNGINREGTIAVMVNVIPDHGALVWLLSSNLGGLV